MSLAGLKVFFLDFKQYYVVVVGLIPSSFTFVLIYVRICIRSKVFERWKNAVCVGFFFSLGVTQKS